MRSFHLWTGANHLPLSVSTGIRFTTMPDATPPSFQIPNSSSPLSSTTKGLPSQPPTTITALFNPMLGHMSGAYTARVSRDVSVSSRFEFNVYSYESEWTMGTEWWLRRSAPQPGLGSGDESPSSTPAALDSDSRNSVHGVVKARASTNKVQFLLSQCNDCNSLTLGCFFDVGRANTEYAGQPGSSV